MTYASILRPRIGGLSWVWIVALAVVVLGLGAGIGAQLYLPVLLVMVVPVLVVIAFRFPFITPALALTFVPLTNYGSSYFSIGTIPGGAVLRDLLVAGIAARWLIGVLAREFSLIPASLTASFGSLLLVFASVLSIYVVTAPDTGVALLGARTTVLYMSLVWFVPTLVRDSITHRRVIYAGLAAGVLVGFVGLLEVVTDGGILNALGYRSDYAILGIPDALPYFQGQRRATGGMGNYLVFGTFMVMIGLVGWAVLQNAQSTIARILAAMVVAASLLGVALSLARGAWLAATIGVVIFVGIRRSTATWRLIALVVVIAAVAIVYSLIGSSLFNDRVLSETSALSSASRIVQLEAAWATVSAHPFGLGLGTQAAAARPGDSLVPDSSMFGSLAELGFLTFGLLILVLVLAAIALLRHWASLKPGFQKDVALAMIASFAAVLVNSTINAVYSSRILNIVFWIWCGLALWRSASSAQAPEVASSPDTLVNEQQSTVFPGHRMGFGNIVNKQSLNH